METEFDWAGGANSKRRFRIGLAGFVFLLVLWAGLAFFYAGVYWNSNPPPAAPGLYSYHDRSVRLSEGCICAEDSIDNSMMKLCGNHPTGFGGFWNTDHDPSLKILPQCRSERVSDNGPLGSSNWTTFKLPLWPLPLAWALCWPVWMRRKAKEEAARREASSRLQDGIPEL